MRACLRLGMGWGEWEHLQPVEIWASWDAEQWRWNRRVLLQAQATAMTCSALGAKVDVEELARALGWRDD